MSRLLSISLTLCAALVGTMPALAQKRPYGTSKPMSKALIARFNDKMAASTREDPEFDIPPILLEANLPIFPISRLLHGESGTCQIVLSVDINGHVVNPHRAPDTDADDKMCDHAIIALRTWRFSPATKSGNPVEAVEIGVVPFHYTAK